MNIKQIKSIPDTKEELQKLIPTNELGMKINEMLKLHCTTMEKVVNIIRFLNKEVKVFGDKGFSFKQLGIITGIDYTYLCKINKKIRENLTVEYIEKFADGLGIDIKTLIC